MKSRTTGRHARESIWPLLRKFYEDVLATLWFRPGLWMIVYAGVAIGLVYLEVALVDAGIDPGDYPLLKLEASGARTLLGAIATAMLTVTSLVFSLMMIAVVQTANAYSPRLLRRYIRDPSNQHVLGILIGTFLFSLVVLRSVSSSIGFTPTIATNVCIALSVVATIALVHFLNHVPQSIKVSSVIELILSRTREVIERGFPRDVGESWAGDAAPELPRVEPKTLLAPRSGYLQFADGARLLATAKHADLVVELHRPIGDYVLEGTRLASVWGELDEELEVAIHRNFVYGDERTLPQDATFGLLQITDIALRALSPGVNDPSTAVSAIDALTYLLGKSLEREPPSRYRCDDDGQPRVILPPLRLRELLDDTYLRIMQYGGQDPLVVRQLLRSCEQLLAVTSRSSQRAALWGLVESIHAHATESIGIRAQRRQLDTLFVRIGKSDGCPPLPSLMV